jgi:hypothetical protein
MHVTVIVDQNYTFYVLHAQRRGARLGRLLHGSHLVFLCGLHLGFRILAPKIVSDDRFLQTTRKSRAWVFESLLFPRI